MAAFLGAMWASPLPCCNNLNFMLRHAFSRGEGNFAFLKKFFQKSVTKREKMVLYR